MDKYPVTHDLFVKAQCADPSHWQENPKTPVERVRWRDAKAYCNERSRLEGLKLCYNEKTVEWDVDYSANGYRLPTEAEWEYAARAGSETPYDFGRPDQLKQYAWFADNAEQKTHPVGQKKPNAWGLYDMYGNVSQWCEDVYSPSYYKESTSVDPTGPPSPGRDVKRVMRGGNWNASAEACRATYRRGERTGNTDACFATDYCGFRCVRRASAHELAKLAERSDEQQHDAKTVPLRQEEPTREKDEPDAMPAFKRCPHRGPFVAIWKRHAVRTLRKSPTPALSSLPISSVHSFSALLGVVAKFNARSFTPGHS